MSAADRPELRAHVEAVLGELSATQLDDLVNGRGRLVFQPRGPRGRRGDTTPSPGFDASTAVSEIRRLDRPGLVAGYLREQGFTVPMLREIARALGPTVPSTARSKDELVHNIAEGTAGYRIRSAAMSGGAWG